MKKTSALGIRLDDETIEALDAFAEDTEGTVPGFDCTRSAAARALIVRGLTEHRRVKAREVGYWGLCPECAAAGKIRAPLFLSVRRQNWATCEEHRTRWLVGKGLFSPPDDETAEDRMAAAAKLEGYREVEPVDAAAVA